MAEKEYIDLYECRDDFYAAVLDILSEDSTNDRANQIIDAFDYLPTADVEPVKHGHWKKGKGYERPTENGFVHDDKYICDCCGWGCCCDTKLDFRYCPNCGAKNGR